MGWFTELFCNPFLITPLVAWLVAQVLKTIIHAVLYGKLDLHRMHGDGGMPSCHSALVSSLAMICLMTKGPGSFEFAVTVILALVVCHDAMGVRRETGKQAIVINELVKAFEVFASPDLSDDVKLKEFVGHSPIQVFAGILVGIATAAIMFFIMV